MRLIDADELLTHIADYGDGQNVQMLIDPRYVRKAPTIAELNEGILTFPSSVTHVQQKYTNRLKAEKVELLEELKAEIEKMHQFNPDFSIWKDGYNTSNDCDCVIIQQKINALKGEEE